MPSAPTPHSGGRAWATEAYRRQNGVEKWENGGAGAEEPGHYCPEYEIEYS